MTLGVFWRPALKTSSLTGTLTESGSVVKKPLRLVSGTATTHGNIIKFPSKHPTGALTQHGSIVKRLTQHYVGTLTQHGAINRKVIRLLSGTITTHGLLVKQIARKLSGSFSSIGSVTYRKIRVLLVTGTLNSAASIRRLFSKRVASSLIPNAIKPTTLLYNLHIGLFQPIGNLVARLLAISHIVKPAVATIELVSTNVILNQLSASASLYIVQATDTLVLVNATSNIDIKEFSAVGDITND